MVCYANLKRNSSDEYDCLVVPVVILRTLPEVDATNQSFITRIPV